MIPTAIGIGGDETITLPAIHRTVIEPRVSDLDRTQRPAKRRCEGGAVMKYPFRRGSFFRRQASGRPVMVRSRQKGSNDCALVAIW